MPHHIYQTTGFVLGGAASGEADRMVFLFTKELGLVRAVAKSVRSAKSKLKSSLQDFTYARLDLVRGKEVWRVTDAEEIARFSPLQTHEKAEEKIKILAGIFSLLKRFVHGEERDDMLFEILRDTFFFLNNEKCTEVELKNLEALAVLRILSALGYVEYDSSVDFTDSVDGKMNHEALADFAPHRTKALKEIHKAFEESHL